MIVYHPTGSNVRLRFLIVDGNGDGATGQTPTSVVRRRSDGQYWTGVGWQVALVNLVMTEESAIDLPGSYYYDFDHAASGGNPDEILVRYRNAAVAPLRGLDEEQHVFRVVASTLNPERRLGHVLADDGVTLRVTVWVEEAGVRVTDYDQVAAQIKDATGTLLVDLGTDTSDTADGLFYFETPVSVVQRNLPYIVAAQATRAAVTDSFNAGFVRV